MKRQLNILLLSFIATGLAVSCAPQKAERSKTPVEQQQAAASQQQAVLGQQQVLAPQTVSAQINWLTHSLRAPANGLQRLDISAVEVMDPNNQPTSLLQYLQAQGKPKAVIQAIDTLPGGNMCGGCLGKAKELSDQVIRPRSDTAYAVVITSKTGTPSQQLVETAKKSIGNPNLMVFRDIDASYNQIGGNTFPTTIVLNSEKHGKIENMHRSQAFEISTILNSL